MGTPSSITAALRHAPVGMHTGGESWGLAWGALEWLERTVEAGWSTLEVGAGLSTVVFAARGAEHEAITPDQGEVDAILSRAASLGIDASGVRFHVGPSETVLPAWTPRPLDLVLIDGAHGFPYPVLDWWHLAPHLRIGGHLLLDDAYLPAVAGIVDHIRSSPSWRLEPAVSFRTAHAVKLDDDAPEAMADAHATHGRLRFSYLPPHRRVVASARQRVFGTALGVRVVERARTYRLGRAARPSDDEASS